MTYNLTISGHVEAATPEEAQKLEHEIAQKAREFVTGLPSVHAAAGGFQHIGAQDLKAPA